MVWCKACGSCSPQLRNRKASHLSLPRANEQEVQDALEAIVKYLNRSKSQKAIVKEEPAPASDALSGEVDALKKMVKQIIGKTGTERSSVGKPA